MRRNRKLYIGIIGAICIIFFLFDPLGHRVQISSDFVEWQYDMPDYAGLKRVEIDGILRTPFLGNKSSEKSNPETLATQGFQDFYFYISD